MAKKDASLRAKKAFKLMVENGGNISKAMRDAGYSPKTAKVPSKLTNQKTFKELLEKYLPDDFLLEKHISLLKKEDDNNAVKSGLDMAYKLKGAYASDKTAEKIADKITSIEFKFPGDETNDQATT